MKKATNNIILTTFPLMILISLSYYLTYILEHRSRLDRFDIFHLIGLFLFFAAFGIFLYHFLVKEPDYSMVALIIGLLSITILVMPYIFMKLAIPLFVVFHNISVSWYVGMMILVIYVVLLAKKIKYI